MDNSKPKLQLSLHRRTDDEKIRGPRYQDWAKRLVEGKPVVVRTTWDKHFILVPSSAFKDNGDFPEGTLIVSYGGPVFSGYAELDFNKKPNPFFLKTKGFPLGIGTLICKTIYAMFPHLNPLTEEDIQTLRASSNTPNRTRKILRLTASSPRKTRKPKPEQTPEPNPAPEPPVTPPDLEVLPPETKAETETQATTDYARSSSKQPESPRKENRRTRSRRKPDGPA